MDYRSYEKRLDYILELIMKNRFRSLEATSLRFGCSTRTIKRMLNHLRDRGHDISYDRQQNKYILKQKEE
jgi:DeoR/GlpR family transcriptional regulator of sugar metabolism